MKAIHPFAKRGLNILDEDGYEGCARCGRRRTVHPAPPVGIEPTSDLTQNQAGHANRPRGNHQATGQEGMDG